MRIEQLYYLVEVSKHPSLNIASEKLHISHQSLNKSIKSLEEELNTQLLTRSSAGISLTPTGQRTVQSAKIILNELTDLKGFINEYHRSNLQNFSGTLKIICTSLTTGTILTPIMNDFSPQLSKVNFSLYEAMAHEVLTKIKTMHYDFGLINMPTEVFSTEYFSDLSYTILQKEEVYALIHKNSSLSRFKSLSIKTLLKHPLIFWAYEFNDENFYVKSLAKYGTLDLDNILCVNNYKLYTEHLTTKNYSSVMTRQYYNSMDPAFRSQFILRPLDERLENYDILIYSKDATPTPLSLFMMELIIKNTGNRAT